MDIDKRRHGRIDGRTWLVRRRGQLAACLRPAATEWRLSPRGAARPAYPDAALHRQTTRWSRAPPAIVTVDMQDSSAYNTCCS